MKGRLDAGLFNFEAQMSSSILACGRFRLDMSQPKIMAIINVTADSFSGDGCPDLDTAVRAAERASRRLATFAQAISSTTPVTPKSIASGVCASLCTELCPRAPGFTVTGFARNFAIVASLMPVWSGASTELMIPR